MTVTIPLTRGLFALVDAEDAPLVAAQRWQAAPIKRMPGSFYAQRGYGGTTVYMHRLLMGNPAGKKVDHIDFDTLNNRRSNLRAATNSQSAVHTRQKLGASGYRGVRCDGQRFSAQIQWNKETIRRHGFGSAVEAAVAYDELALEIHGEFAVLNFSRLVRAA